MEKLLIIDGNSIINRAFYGIRMLNSPDGRPTNGIYGFLNILFKYLDEENPSYLAVAFDLKAPTFRHLEYAEYKAQRKGMPEELAEQMPIMKEILRAMNITILEQEGFEADDIIGTVSKMCEEAGVECLIATGDKDDLQLASIKTKILLTTTRNGQSQTEVFDEDAVEQKYGVTPQEFIDVKGLMGDASDNIPGVKGIGEKTAFSLIGTYKSIDAIYEKIEEIDVTKSVREKLKAGKDSAYLSRRLATIVRNVPIESTIEDMKRCAFDEAATGRMFLDLGFKSFLKRLEIQPEAKAEDSPKVSAALIEDEEALSLALSEVKKEKQTYYYIYKQDGDAQAVAFSCKDTIYFAPLGLFLPLDAIRELFEDKEIVKIGHGIKEDIVLLNEYGIGFENIGFDTLLGAYLLEPSRSSYAIDEILEVFLNKRVESEAEILGKGKGRISILELEESAAASLAGGTISAMRALHEYMEETLNKLGQHKLYYEIELPLLCVLADMQINGFTVDKEQLKAFSEKLGSRIQELEGMIFFLAGEEFNINSPKQLGTILFEKLGLPSGKKTKTGYSTGAEVLEKLRGKHDIIELLMEYRQLIKLKSTYADGLQGCINPQTGKIHSTFNQAVTNTGRISSTEPNMQNIPVRMELGREVRKMFTASDDEHVLVDADYSQIELRVLSHISEDKNMIDAFLHEADIHTITASQVFGVPIDEVTPQMRSGAKAVNFGIVYGIGEYSLSQDLGITRKEAKAYIDAYLEKYEGVRCYMENIVKTAKENGYVTTLLGRRRYIPELKSSNFNIRSFGERAAMNAPIQGSAADIIKIAMVRVYKKLKEQTKDSHLILQVHDELIVEANKAEIDTVVKIVKEEMEAVYPMAVPLVADLNTGWSWYEAK